MAIANPFDLFLIKIVLNIPYFLELSAEDGGSSIFLRRLGGLSPSSSSSTNRCVSFPEKEERDEGVHMVERWLSSDREFTELELLKAWKALFFCATSSRPLVILEFLPH